MSARLFPDDTKFLQRVLSLEGFYTGTVDGVWGPMTEDSLMKFEKLSEKILRKFGEFDFRSEVAIRSLQTPAQDRARACLAALWEHGWEAKILSGTRTYSEQQALYAQGRDGNPGQIVTKARPGQSLHNFGIAWDIGLFDGEGGSYIQDNRPYDEAADDVLNNVSGIVWGGDWKWQDRPHYQLHLQDDLATVRQKFEDCIAFV